MIPRPVKRQRSFSQLLRKIGGGVGKKSSTNKLRKSASGRRFIERQDSTSSTLSAEEDTFPVVAASCPSNTNDTPSGCEPIPEASLSSSSLSLAQQQDEESSSSSSSPKVRFAETTRVRRYRNDTPVNELWFSKTDYSRFAQAQALVAKGLRVTHTSAVQTFRDTHKACRNVPFETNFCCLTRSEEEALGDLYSNMASSSSSSSSETDWVGLEETVMGAPSRQVDERRQALYKAVRQRTKRIATEDQHEERLRLACQDLSRPGRLWARHVAQARLWGDELAACQ